MKRATTRNFHVPLPAALYERLHREAKRSGHPATEIARHAIRQALAARARAALYEELNAFANAHAGSRYDLDPELEAASLDSLGDLP